MAIRIIRLIITAYRLFECPVDTETQRVYLRIFRGRPRFEEKMKVGNANLLTSKRFDNILPLPLSGWLGRLVARMRARISQYRVGRLILRIKGLRKVGHGEVILISMQAFRSSRCRWKQVDVRIFAFQGYKGK